MSGSSLASSRTLFIEVASIVFAVVLGFAVTNWDMARRERERAGEALERIRLELEENHDAVEVAVPYYRLMAQRLDSILAASGDAPTGSVSIPGWRGLAAPRLRSASFLVAMQTGALERVPFELADELALAYGTVDDLASAIEHALGALMAGGLRTLGDWRAVFAVSAELAAAAQAQTEQALAALSSSGP